MAIAQEWWDRWWEEDWSWEGLAEKPWRGWVVLPGGLLVEDVEFNPFSKKLWHHRFPKDTRLANLQDYWRQMGCADDLYQEPGSGKRFTLMHLPPTWRDGSKTLKSDPANPPEALIALLKIELERKIEKTVFDSKWQVKKSDHRLQWNGAVLPDFSLSKLSAQDRNPENRIPLAVTANSAAFIGNAYFRRASFSEFTSFSGAAFFEDADFNEAAFSGSVSFTDTLFMGAANFLNVIVLGSASFKSSAFSTFANFRHAVFHYGASFNSVLFSYSVDFMNVGFQGYADFEKATFCDFTFFGSAAFSEYASFQKATFLGSASFRSAAFSDIADFNSAVFLSGAFFSGQGNSVRSQAVKAVIRPEPGDAGVQIYEQAEDVMWTARRSFPSADFHQTFFLERAQFDNRDFHSQTSFGGAVFLHQTAFHSAELHRGVHFRDTSFAFALERGRSPLSVRPTSRKSGWRNLRNGLLDWLFSKSRPTRLEWSQVQTIISARRQLYNAFRQAFGDDVPRWRYWKVFFAQFLENREMEFQRQPQHQKNLYYAGVEDCFRTLKHKMEDRRDRGQEARFFKMELLARRERRRDPHVPWWEGPMSWIYRATSDFGTSFAQPLIVLFLMVLPVFAFTYWCMILLPYGFFFGEGETPSAATWGEALSFSLGRVFPFGPWGDPETCSAIGQMLSPLSEGKTCAQPRTFGPGTPIGLRVLASVQSLIALVLVFLSGLAIRRRFQIN